MLVHALRKALCCPGAVVLKLLIVGLLGRCRGLFNSGARPAGEETSNRVTDSRADGDTTVLESVLAFSVLEFFSTAIDSSLAR
jgi:hypothetical protein